jgi:membrane protease YdiL (CAAX protease family)
MLPLIYLVSQHQSFLLKYPFYKPSLNEPLYEYFLWWEILYFIQFIGVEFFFRGFLIHATKHRFGIYSVYVSLLPYVMIHFGKPFPETIGAIAAGLVLGLLSYKSKSVIPGIFLHYSVAITMDILAL